MSSTTYCSCPHTATREGMIRNGRDASCPVHGDLKTEIVGTREPLSDPLVQEILTNVRTINRVHVSDVRWDQTIARDRHGKTIFDYTQEALEELQRARATFAQAAAAKDPNA